TLGVGDIVSIHAGDPSCAGLCHPTVQCSHDSLVFQRDDADAGILCGEFRQDFRSAVGATIIDDDELEVTEGLAEDAPTGCRDVTLAIPDGHDDGNEGGDEAADRSLNISA